MVQFLDVSKNRPNREKLCEVFRRNEEPGPRHVYSNNEILHTLKASPSQSHRLFAINSLFVTKYHEI
jgi:hypothetical protein